ncbi:MAG: nucleotidyl transferase AbiEii/AbiGii toxin family protein [Clostridia bacterium]|nr:nucleotidyl transferase AbiEii/AbiGii toxin family protein [Clostridia bacterium]
MGLTSAQIKGRIKKIAAENSSDARVLMRLYMMERFLERLSVSRYKDDFIIKGGILVTSMVGVAMRSTMDIDASISNFTLDEGTALKVIQEICDVSIPDNVSFTINKLESIMDDMEYPGLRIHLSSFCDGINTPIKIDISTGDAITPRAVEYPFRLMLEDRNINLWTYNIETVMAEKLQTILARDIANTRMRDFYDIHTLLAQYESKIDCMIFKQAFVATCKKRGTSYLTTDLKTILSRISGSSNLDMLWSIYQSKYPYANGISFSDTIASITKLSHFLA